MTKNSLLRNGISLVWLAGLLIVDLGWYQAWSTNLSTASEIYIGIGSLFGLIATYLFLTQFMLISGDKFIESRWGLDKLSRSHANNGQVAFYILLLHVAFIVIGYNLRVEGAVVDIPATYFDIVKTVPGALLAALAVWLFVFVIVSSIVMVVRKRINYEVWHYIHFVTYLAVLLPIFHQLSNGSTVRQDWFRSYWIALYVLAFGTILWYKWLKPLVNQLRFGFRVEKVVAEANGISSIYVSSPKLSKFKWKAGQFAFWWAPVKGLWYEPHPYTISSASSEGLLRFTPKAVGSGSQKMHNLKPGDPILIDGPYGRFTSIVETKAKRLFIAGGVGVTPIRAMLGDGVESDDVLIYGAQTKDDLAFYDDFVKWAKKKGLKLQVVLSGGAMKNALEGYIDGEKIAKLVPDVKDRDIWLCGPPVMMNGVEKALIEMQVPKSQIHTERFSL